MNYKPLYSLCFSLALFGLVSVANAVPIVFSGGDPGAGPTSPRPGSDAAAASFDAAAGATSIITFESAPVGSFSSLVVAPGVTISGTDFFGADQSIQDSPHFPIAPALDGYNTTAGGTNYAEVLGGTLTFAFSKPIDVFGAYFSGVQDPTFGSVTLTFNDGTSEVIPFIPFGPSGGLQFVGFTDIGASIVDVTIVSGSGGGGDFIGVDDVRFGPASVPDTGSTALLLGLGVVGCFFTQRALRCRQAGDQATQW